MTTIRGAEIENLITLFNTRGVKFYHACQYKDFKTYLKIVGVPSRNIMEQRGLPYTPFDTDENDRNNSVWDMVFGNLSDSGTSFAYGKIKDTTAPTPNPYGPILLAFKPEVFREAEDVAICLRSAGAKDFNRENEALPNIESVNRIFKHENIEDAPNEYSRSYVAFSDTLKERFRGRNEWKPEVSCATENEILSFNQLFKIIVDPYVINNQSLIEKIRVLKKQYSLNISIDERTYTQGENRFETMQELANLLLQEPATVTIQQIIQNHDQTSDSLRDWATRIQTGNVSFSYDRFVNYLKIGTLLDLAKESEQ